MGYELWFNRDGSTTGWSQADEIWFNIDGTTSGWKQADEGWVNIDGTTTGWKQFWPEPITPSFVDTDACYDEFSCTPVGTKFSGCTAWTVQDCSTSYHINIAWSQEGGSYTTRTDTLLCADGNCSLKSACYSWATDGITDPGCYFDNVCWSGTSSDDIRYRLEIHANTTHTLQDQVIILKSNAGCTAA